MTGLIFSGQNSCRAQSQNCETKEGPSRVEGEHLFTWELVALSDRTSSPGFFRHWHNIYCGRPANYFRFTIHVSAEEHVTLLVETGEQPIMGGPPDQYSLHILNESQVDEVKRMLDALPDLFWWKQKAMGIILSPLNK